MSPARARRLLSLWLPRFSAERLLRRDLSCGPFAVLAEIRGALVLVSPCAEAEALGLRAGMALSDARAMVPDLRGAMRDTHAEARARDGLLRWAGRWTPWAAAERGLAPPRRGAGPVEEDPATMGGAGLALDISGCAHLFGGEAEMGRRMLDALADMGFAARAGIADSRGAAWALARFSAADAGARGRSGDDVSADAHATRVRSPRRSAARAAPSPAPPPESAPGPAVFIAPPEGARAALAPLPVAALRIPPATAQSLARLGVLRVGDLLALPRAGLSRRFGADLVLRLDQALGVSPEPVSPAAHRPPLSARLSLPEPIGLAPDLAAAFARVAAALCARLEAQGMGARRLLLSIRRADGGGQEEALGLARPSRDPALIGRLTERVLERFDPGHGVDAVRIAAIWAEPLTPGAHAGHAAAAAEAAARMAPGGGEAFAELMGRIGARIGLDRLARFHAAESHLPEKTARMVPAAHAAPQSPGWREKGGAWAGPHSAPRPILLWRPEPLTPLVPGRPPELFRWRRAEHGVALAEGPERIAPEWWLDDPEWRSGPRDYWRIETDEGRRLWLFEALGGEIGGGWFVHGPL